MILPLLPGAMLWFIILIVFGGMLAIALAIGTEPRPHPVARQAAGLRWGALAFLIACVALVVGVMM
jgi:hypothetical protein